MNETASGIQLWGAFGFGVILGWYTYFTNRYRKDVQIGDLAAVVGVLGGAGILALFPAKTDLFGYYGIGLVAGFFGYLILLAIFVAASKEYDFHWFLDGRRKDLPKGWEIPEAIQRTVHPMDQAAGGGAVRR